MRVRWGRVCRAHGNFFPAVYDELKRLAARRGGGARTITLDGDARALGDPDLILDADAALKRLACEDPSSAEVIRHRLFAGLTIDETVEALGLSRVTAFRKRAYARPGWPPRSGLADDRRRRGGQ
jgi:ECF sigma factor